MSELDIFRSQLARTIQAWLGVETEVYIVYSILMRGANSHLISATFNHIESFDSKLALLNSCMVLCFSRESSEFKSWKTLYNKALKLNKKRNKIVHEPIKQHAKNGVTKISIAPSGFNSLAIAKGQTNHKGPVVGGGYTLAQLLDDHMIDLKGLKSIEKSFEVLAGEFKQFRGEVSLLYAKSSSAKR